MKDDVLEEVYEARKKIAAECDYDFQKLLERYQRMQAENPQDLVYEVPKSDPEPVPTE
jgi:hypothetical protein